MNIQEILKYLPHRYPFILIDKVERFTPGESLEAVKNVTINEPFFMGHFPGNPVMPGVLILEALAQASVVLSHVTDQKEADGSVLHYFAGIDNARFKQIVEPGDQLRLSVEVLKSKRDLFKIHGEAHVGEQLACSADLMCVKKGVDTP